jgi:hypothetical protein
MSTPDRWTATVASLAGEPAPALPAGRGRRHRLRDTDADPTAEIHDALQFTPRNTTMSDSNTTTTTSTREARFLAAASEVLQGALESVRREDPDAATGVAEALRAGALIELKATLSHRTRTGWLAVHVTVPGHEPFQLCEVELRHREVQ